MLWYLKFNYTNIMRLRRINLKKSYVGRNALSAWGGRWDQQYTGEGQLDTGCREGVTALPGRREQDGSVQGEGPRGPSSCSPQCGQCIWILVVLLGDGGPHRQMQSQQREQSGQRASWHPGYIRTISTNKTHRMMKYSAAWQWQHGPNPRKRKSRPVNLKTKDLMDFGLCPKTHLKKRGKTS